MRDGRVEPQEAETYLKQYVETAQGRARPPGPVKATARLVGAAYAQLQ